MKFSEKTRRRIYLTVAARMTENFVLRRRIGIRKRHVVVQQKQQIIAFQIDVIQKEKVRIQKTERGEREGEE